jgi:hypothetical protein
MAKPPKPAKDQKSAAAPNPLEVQTIERRRECRRWKEQWSLDFKECYFFASPHRNRQISSQTLPPKQRAGDAAELQTSLAFLLAQDFVTEVVNTYMPEAQHWCERGPGMILPPEIWDKIKDKVKQSDGQIFSAMKASNLYSEIQKSFYPDLAIGTCGLWIDRRSPAQPISCSAIPLRELEVNLGPDGEIDDRFAVRYTRNSYVQALLPDVTLPDDVAELIKSKPSDRTEISWGFWRLWDRDDDEWWQHVVLLKDKLVHHAEIKGEGCCPLQVPRFNPSADWPWGLGPMIQSLPDLRQIDELEGMKIENVELHIAPPITYPDDSFAAIEQGLEPRMAYPVRPGSEKAVQRIYDPPPPDAAIYQHEEMEHRLRKLFFIDYPEQTGDTPPTLGQWLDEMARAQRRIGTPGMSFWREGPAKIFLRFKYLLEAAGAIEPVKVDGKIVALLPYNPAQRAAEQQEIATATQAAQILAQMFPEEWKMSIDGHATMQAFVDKMRVSGLLKFRDPNQVKQFIQQASQLTGGAQAMAGAQPSQRQAQPAPPPAGKPMP